MPHVCDGEDAIGCGEPAVGTVDRLGFALVVSMPLISLSNIFRIVEIGGLSIRPVDFLFVSAWVAWGVRLAVARRIDRRLLAFFAGLHLYAVITLLGLLLVDDHAVDWPRYLRFVQTMLWGALALTFIRSERQFMALMNNVIIVGIVMAAISIGLYAINPELHRIAGYVSFAGGEGLEGQASYNEWGALYALILGLLLWRFYKREPLSLGLLPVFPVIVAGLLLVQSRSALLAILPILVVLLGADVRKLCAGRISKRTVVLSLVLILIITAAAVALKSLAINRIVASFAAESHEYASMEVRFDLWQRSVDLWGRDIRTFLLGYGGRTFSELLRGPTADSFYLDHALSEGSLGLLLVLSLVVVPALQVWISGRCTREASIGVLVVVVALTVSLTGNVLVDPLYGGATFLLLYGALAVYDRRDGVTEKP